MSVLCPVFDSYPLTMRGYGKGFTAISLFCRCEEQTIKTKYCNVCDKFDCESCAHFAVLTGLQETMNLIREELS